MSMTAINKVEVVRPTTEQYRALQHPVTLPSRKELFDFMVETLVAKELALYNHADPFRNRLPAGLFLLVPPQPKELDLNHLMSLIEVSEKKGHNYLNPKELADEIEVPEGPYIMVDVEDGKLRLNTKPSVSRQNIQNEGRSPYTTWRGIIHAVVFPKVFQSHNMDLVGSHYWSVRVLGLSLDDGRPKLDAYWLDSAYPEWAAPSCGSVIVP